MKLFRLKKPVALMTAAVLAATMLTVSVSAASAATPKTPKGFITEHDALYAQYGDAIDDLAEGLYNMEEEIELYSYQIPSSLVGSIYETCVHTHPELFYLSENYYYSEFTYSGDSTAYIYSYSPIYTVTAAELAQKRALFYEKADWFLSFVSEDMSDFEKAMILHDEIILNSTYVLDKDIYGIMVEGEGKCYGYALVYAYLLSQVGVRTEFVASDTMNHAWVKVCIDGEYYNVDPTWDDPTVDRPGLVGHFNFLVSDQAFQSGSVGCDVHTDYTTDHPSPTTYDNAAFRNAGSKVCFTDYGVFMVNNLRNTANANQILSYNVSSGTVQTFKEITDRWDAGGGYVWSNTYTGLAEQDNYLYYNTPTAVYAVDLTDGSEQVFAQNTYQNQFYGVRIKDGVVYASLSPSPDDARTVVEVGNCLERVQEPVLALGDANGDSIVDICDATQIQRSIAGLEELTAAQTLAADFNQDGVVSIDDVTMIQMYLAGFPV